MTALKIMNYKTPVLKGDYKRGVVIPEKNIEKLIEKFGWVKIVFSENKGREKKRNFEKFFGLWENNPEIEKAIYSLKKEWTKWAPKTW